MKRLILVPLLFCTTYLYASPENFLEEYKEVLSSQTINNPTTLPTELIKLSNTILKYKKSILLFHDEYSRSPDQFKEKATLVRFTEILFDYNMSVTKIAVELMKPHGEFAWGQLKPNPQMDLLYKIFKQSQLKEFIDFLTVHKRHLTRQQFELMDLNLTLEEFEKMEKERNSFKVTPKGRTLQDNINSISLKAKEVGLIKDIGLVNISYDDAKEIRDMLISWDGSVSEDYKGVEGVNKFLRNQLTLSLDSQIRVLTNVASTLSPTELKDLSWPVDFETTLELESKILKKVKKRRSEVFSTVIDVKSSVKKGIRR